MSETTFQSLKKNLKKDFSSFKTVKLAVLGDSATQLYVQAIKGYGYELSIHFEIFEADFAQIDLQILNPMSELYAFQPEFIIIAQCTNRLEKKFALQSVHAKRDFADTQIKNIENLYQSVLAQIKCKVIYLNFPEVNDIVFGNYSNKTDVSFLYQIRKINFELMNLAQKFKNLFILDVHALQSLYGHDFITDHKIYINTDLLFSIDFLPVLVKHTVDIIQSIIGKFKKCLILDLDNTLWGGIIGDDGVENIQIGELGIGKAFSEFQLWIKQLKQRGIILAVCSKNNETTAKEPFEKHPDMILRLEDIAIFVANWDNKAENIKYIQQVLNIGVDSMVFLDDSSFERNLVLTHIPDIMVPELPEDPAAYLNCIRKLNLFETASFTPEDEQRTLQYQEEAQRSILQKQFVNEDEFLKSLNMCSVVAPFNSFNLPRVAQLTQRSNQFNLRTVRYSEEEIQTISNDSNYMSFAFTLSDKFGDYGLISVVILKKQNNRSLFIDTWIMSCRVLKRNMEFFVLNTIVEEGVKNGFEEIEGEFLSTPKNSMVKDHYKNLGFTLRKDGIWTLSLSAYQSKFCTIASVAN